MLCVTAVTFQKADNAYSFLYQHQQHLFYLTSNQEVAPHLMHQFQLSHHLVISPEHLINPLAPAASCLQAPARSDHILVAQAVWSSFDASAATVLEKEKKKNEKTVVQSAVKRAQTCLAGRRANSSMSLGRTWQMPQHLTTRGQIKKRTRQTCVSRTPLWPGIRKEVAADAR